eukprot:gene4659-3341_t
MYSSPDTSGRLTPPPPPLSAGQSPAPGGENSPEPDEEYVLMKVIPSDRSPQTINLKITRKNITRDVTKSVAAKLKLSKDEGKLHNLVMVLTTTDLKHCIRTLSPDESILMVLETMVRKMSEKYQIADSSKLKSSVRWFYKDMRTPPLDLGDSGGTVGEYDSDDEETLSESDCFYFSKVEKKGYMLKRSNKDINVWKRWYCVLTDHLWCIDFNREPYKVICIRLHSLVRARDGYSFSDQIQNIIVNSLKGSHYFRAFNIMDQRSWIEHLQAWTTYVVENESMTMAEVIMNDEEESKSRRFRKQLGRVLDSDTVYDAICVDRRRPTIAATGRKAMELEDELASISEFFEEEKRIGGPSEGADGRQTGSPPNGDGTVCIDTESLEEKEPASGKQPSLELPSADDIEAEAEAETETETASPRRPALALSSSSSSSALPVMTASSPISHSSYARLYPLDRTLTQSTIHRLHQHEFLLSYLMGFLVDVLQYKELFRHDLFCSVQSQRDAAFSIFTKYFHKQARRAGIPLHHDKLREIADEQAEMASTRLKETMSNQFSYTRPRDTYIASPGSLMGGSLAAPSASEQVSTAASSSSSAASTAMGSSFNSAAMRSPSSNVQRQRDQSLLIQRLRSQSSSSAAASVAPTSAVAAVDGSASGLVTPMKAHSSSFYRTHDEVTEDNWQLPSQRFEKIIQALFGDLIRVQIESEEESSDNLDALSPTRTSTYLSAHDIKSLASSRKASLHGAASGANSPNPTGRTSPLRGNSMRNPQAPASTPTTSGLSSFFGLFGGGGGSTSAPAPSGSSSASGRAAVGSGPTGGGGLFLSRRFGNRGATGGTGKSETANAAILQALEEDERNMVMSQIIATAEVFDEAVEDIIALLH